MKVRSSLYYMMDDYKTTLKYKLFKCGMWLSKCNCGFLKMLGWNIRKFLYYTR